MSDDLHDTGQRFRELIAGVDAQVEETITPELARRVSRIYLTGCGDSYFAAIAARLFYDRYVGLPVEPVEGMEFSRYVAPYALSDDALVIVISNSGRVSRTVEAAIQSRRRGATTIAATAYADRPLAQEADAAILGSLPNVRATLANLETAVSDGALSGDIWDLSEPGAAQRLAQTIGIGGSFQLLMLGLGAYYASVLILYLVGLRLAVLRGRLTAAEAEQLRARIAASIDDVTTTADRLRDPVSRLARTFRDHDTFLFLGSGPSYATALLSAAKLFEQPHLNGVPQQLEEWAHQQFFFTRPDGPPIFVVVPPGDSRDRALEQIAGSQQVGATVVAICDAEDEEIIGVADHALPIFVRRPETFSEALTPLTYVVPGQLFAFAMLEVRGQPSMKAPYDFQRLMEVNHRQIYGSDVRRPGER
ncbi:MAG: SIS domain-containing protein [Candidatus Promineifilaceae bacterium]|nr:SIS domain-containing protein [Candidatus Promineifilaceae bacterium]